MIRYWAGLGANLGNREEQLAAALCMVRAQSGGQLLALSSLYGSKPLGPPDQPDYCNAAFAGTSTLSALELLALFKAVEEALGRRPRARWREREIDIDLLLVEDQVIDTKQLVLPHPQMARRRFVLAPLAEIAPELWHPVLGQTVAELLARCSDSSAVWPYGSIPQMGAQYAC